MSTFQSILTLIIVSGVALLAVWAVAAWRRRGGPAVPGRRITLRRQVPRGPGGTAPVGPARDTWLVMPDITGYTRFLHRNHFAEVHAQHLVTELLQALMAAAPPALTVAKVEGDAVLLFASTEGRGARSVEEVEQALAHVFQAFYRRRQDLIRSNLCRCATCRHIDELELKAVVHRGPVTNYRLGNFIELSGMAVIVVHRLLKNSIRHRRYVLVTDAAQAIIPSFAATGESVEERGPDIGAIGCRVYPFDLPDTSDGGVMRRSSGYAIRDTAGKIAAILRNRPQVSRHQTSDSRRAPDR